MCELYFIKSLKDGLVAYDIEQIATLLKAGGISNPDGYGITDGIKIIKREAKYTDGDFKLLSNFSKVNFLIGHVRFKTSGKQKKSNSHPFYNKRFVWLHNGIIHNYTELAKRYNIDINVDSELIGELLYKKTGDNENIDIAKCLKEVLSEFNGSLSVFIYDRLTDKLYYFKNSGTSFIFAIAKSDTRELLIGLTDGDKLNHVYKELKNTYVYGMKTYKYPVVIKAYPKDDMIYLIDNKGFKELGEFSNMNFDYTDTYTVYGKNTGLKNYTVSYNIREIENILFAYYHDDEIQIKKVKKGKKKLYKLYASDSTHEDILNLSSVNSRELITYRELTYIVNAVEFELKYWTWDKTEYEHTEKIQFDDLDNKYDPYGNYNFDPTG